MSESRNSRLEEPVVSVPSKVLYFYSNNEPVSLNIDRDIDTRIQELIANGMWVDESTSTITRFKVAITRDNREIVFEFSVFLNGKINQEGNR